MIRPAQASDAEAVRALVAILGYQPSPALFAEMFAEHLDSDRARLFVADAGTQERSRASSLPQEPMQERSRASSLPQEPLLGMLAACRIPLLHHGWMGRISALAVAPVAHRQGIGRALMVAAEAWFGEHGCRRLEVTSNARRLDAHRFYAALGYAEASKRFIKDPAP